MKYYLCLTILWVLGLFFGPGFILFGVWRFYIEMRWRNWNPVPGRITKSLIIPRRMNSGYAYEAHIEFAFSQCNVTIVKKASLLCTGSMGYAEALIRKYPDGSEVNVFVNPKNPSQVSLEMQPSPYNWISIIVGLIILTQEVKWFLPLHFSK